MIFKQVGDIKVSSVVLGTDAFGTSISEKDSFDLMDTYFELGGNTIDTARVYGCHHGGSCGASEQTIGRWMASRKCRSKIIISTKCAHPRIDTMNTGRLSEREIESDIDESLLALGTDYIDILWLHRDDMNRVADEIVNSLEKMVSKGKIRCYGASNWRAERFDAANSYAESIGKRGFCASQIKWSMAKSSPSFIDDPTLVEMNAAQYSYYKTAKMPVFAYASQAKGFFQKYAKGGAEALSAKSRERYLCTENTAMYEKLAALSAKAGVPLSAAVISALTSNTDFDTAAIVGCRTPEQLKDTMSGADTVLSYDEIKKIFRTIGPKI